MAKANLVTYGAIVKTTLSEDFDLLLEWKLDGSMTAYQSFNVKTAHGQDLLSQVCKATGKLSIGATDDLIGNRCRVMVNTYTPCDCSNTFFFVVGFDI